MSRIPNQVSDPFAFIAEKAKEGVEYEYWRSIDRRPPRGCGAVGMEWYRRYDKKTPHDLIAQVYSPTSELNFDSNDPFTREHDPSIEEREEEARVISRGKDVFYRYFPAALLGMVLGGLAGGFASPRIVTVLSATGYLIQSDRNAAQRAADRLRNLTMHAMFLPREEMEGETITEAARERTFKRLLETLQFILDVMGEGDSLASPKSHARGGAGGGGGLGWMAATKVRFLHARVRQRIMNGKDAKHFAETVGTPINQEDLLATLCLFSIAPLSSLDRMGVRVSAREREDFVALWRHVGYYMGIQPRLLRRCFRDYQAADCYFFCVSSHHYLGLQPEPTEQMSLSMSQGRGLKGAALPLLYSITDRPPVPLSFATNCAISRNLLGDPLADALFLPQTSLKQRLMLPLLLTALVAPSFLFRYYWRVGWRKEAQACLRLYLEGYTAKLIGGKQGTRRATFDMRHGLYAVEVKNDGVRPFLLLLELVFSLLALTLLVFLSMAIFSCYFT